MTDIRCSCGFTELADETLTDHLHREFAPDDSRGNDGRIHEETTPLACACGVVAAEPGALDEHFLAVFTSADRIGRDGKKHELAYAFNLPCDSTGNYMRTRFAGASGLAWYGGAWLDD